MSDFNTELYLQGLLETYDIEDSKIIAEEILSSLKKHGWLHLPQSEGRNVTVFTHDSAEERFMTWDEWETEAVKLGWKKG